MKALTYILSIIAAGLVIFNLTQIDYSNPLQGDSIVALITVITGLCAILLLTILRVSKKIEKLQKIKS
jgi:predicted membrane protein